MRARWQGLEHRERRTLVLGALAAALLLGWLLVWQPLAKARAELRQRVAQDAAELEWMDRAVMALGNQPTAIEPLAVDDGRSLLARVDAGARDAGLGSALLRVEPVAEGEVRMAFQGADFDALVAWLQRFSRQHGATVTELSVQREEGVGLVGARVALREARAGGS